jgi:hypothetical protein
MDLALKPLQAQVQQLSPVLAEVGPRGFQEEAGFSVTAALVEIEHQAVAGREVDQPFAGRVDQAQALA